MFRYLAGAAAAMLTLASTAFGQGSPMMGIFSAGNRPTNVVTGKMGYSWVAPSNVAGQSDDFGYNQSTLQLSFSPPLDGPISLTAGLSGTTLQYQSQNTFPESGERHPPALWKINLNLGAAIDLGEERTLSFTIGGGTNADHPFFSGREMSFFSVAFLKLPQGKDDAWLLALFFGTSGAELTSIPIPAVAYLWKPCKEFQAVVGLPFVFLMVNPWKPLRIFFSYFPITNVRLGAMLQLGPVSITAGWAIESDAYRVAEWDDARERVYHYRSKLSGGFSVPIFFKKTGGPPESTGEGIDQAPYALPEGEKPGKPKFSFATLNFTGGWSFYRFSFRGTGLEDYKEDRFDISDGGFVSVELQFRF